MGLLFVNDGQMKRLNARYRGIGKTTDVLSFPLYASRTEFPEEQEYLLGDIVINLQAAGRQSVAYSSTFTQEVRRLLIHGFLHLLGYDHEKSTYQRKRMEKQERELIHALEAMD